MSAETAVKTGDAPEIEDVNFQKMMRRLRSITRKGAELDPEALRILEQQEEAAKLAKKRKRGAAATAAATKQRDETTGEGADAPFLIQTKSARASAAASSRKEANTNNNNDEDIPNDADNGEEDNSDCDDDKFLPSYIRECLDEDVGDLKPESSPDTPSPQKTQPSVKRARKAAVPPGGATDNADAASAACELFDKDYEPIIWVRNIVVTGFSHTNVNIEYLVPRLMPFGVYQNKRRFIAMTRRTCRPRSSTLAFGNGKFVNTGAQTVEAGKASIESFVAKIADVDAQVSPGVFVKPYADMRIRNFNVHNMVGSTCTPFSIDLQAFSRYSFVRYFEKLFVGAIVTVKGISQAIEDKDVKALVFSSGNVVITGTKTTEHIRLVNALLYPYLARCAVQSTLPAEARVTKSRQRRYKADKRKVDALPANSESIIQLDSQSLVDEYHAVNNNRATAQQVLEREREQKSGDLSQLPTATRNMIAMSTMYPETTGAPQRLLVGAKKSVSLGSTQILNSATMRIIGE